MKKLGILMLALTLCCSLAACGGNAAASASVSSSGGASSSAAPAASTSADAGAERAEAVEAYRTALTALLENQVLPDGTPCAEADADLSGNKFAIYDVDGDGRDELLLFYTTTCMAGMVGQVYDYDAASQTLRQELSEYPALTFYTGGTVIAEWSHNQGLAGDFWPFSLYQYDAAADIYTLAGTVDAWEKSLKPDGFPDDVDVSGSGYVYYIGSGDEAAEVAPVDDADYQTWLNGYLKDGEALEITFSDLTAEQIAALAA